MRKAIERLTSMGYIEYALMLAILPLLEGNCARIEIAQVYPPATLLRNTGRQGHLDAWYLATGSGIIAARTLDMGAMGKNAARHIFEALPLLEEVVAHVVADLVDQPTMCVGDFANMRCIDNHFAAIGDDR